METVIHNVGHAITNMDGNRLSITIGTLEHLGRKNLTSYTKDTRQQENLAMENY